MSNRRSAGILLYRTGASGEPQVLIVHPGGPLWARRDAGAWSIPKGELEPGEEPLPAARREFAEELGHAPPAGEALELGEVRLRSGKVVRAFGLAGDLDAAAVVSNAFEMQWPPGSGRRERFPEVDRALWCDLPLARAKLNPAQVPLLDRLADQIPSPRPTPEVSSS